MEAEGRKRRFDRLYDACYENVRRYAWRRAPGLADDVVAETFLVAWRRLDDIPEEPLPWLIGVARNVLLNMRRAERRQEQREARVQQLDPGGEERAFADVVGEFSALRASLEALPERDREILFLSAWEEFDPAAIAAIMGCTRANVALRLFRARKRLAAAVAAGSAGPACSAPPDAGGAG